LPAGASAAAYRAAAQQAGPGVVIFATAGIDGYREAYRNFRRGNAKGAKGEVGDAAAGESRFHALSREAPAALASGRPAPRLAPATVRPGKMRRSSGSSTEAAHAANAGRSAGSRTISSLSSFLDRGSGLLRFGAQPGGQQR
jgi:hypothetical protein